MQELKAMINKRDSELGRIREQRDQYYAELNERRAKESTKLASIAEFKTLAEARAVRIRILPRQLGPSLTYPSGAYSCPGIGEQATEEPISCELWRRGPCRILVVK